MVKFGIKFGIKFGVGRTKGDIEALPEARRALKNYLSTEKNTIPSSSIWQVHFPSWASLKWPIWILQMFSSLEIIFTPSGWVVWALVWHRGFKWQKPAKKYIRKFVKLSGSDLCLQQFDKFLKGSACNHWKCRLCKSAEIDFGKFCESISIIRWTYFWRVLVIWNLCAATYNYQKNIYCSCSYNLGKLRFEKQRKST